MILIQNLLKIEMKSSQTIERSMRSSHKFAIAIQKGGILSVLFYMERGLVWMLF